MIIIKKSSAFILLLAMLISVVCVAPFDVFAAETHNVGNADELQAACADINTKGGEHIISLTDNISGGVSIDISKSDAVVTVIGNGHTVSSTGQAVCVLNGATVNLGDGTSTLTLTSDDNDGGDPGIVYVIGKDSKCQMYDKVTLKDHKGNNYFGGGVTVEGGTFKMHGGTIDNCGIDGGSVCYGGGVAVINGGLFEMNGGTIKKCYAKSSYIDDYDPNRCFTAMGGGVFVTSGSTFTMNGGTISNNEATNFGGGIALDISYNEISASEMGRIKSKVVINNGTIKDNKADSGAGIFVSGYFYCYAAIFKGHDYGGIGTPSNPGFYINSGEISGNEAKGMGGGVLIAMIRPNKATISNASVTNNRAYDGAGIENYGYWTQLDIDGCTITGNEAEINGGGFLASTNSSGGYTTIKNTTIKDNTSGDRGAGVYYDANSEIRISGADVIQNNTYEGKKNNLNVLSLEKPVKVVGDLTGSQIGLSDPTLWDDNKTDVDSTAVSTEYLTNGYKTNNPVKHPSEYFTSDHESWYVDRSQSKTTTVVDTSSKKYRKYTVNRYPVASNNNNPFGVVGDYLYFQASNPDELETSLDTLFNELVNKYSPLAVSTSIDQNAFKRYNTSDGTQITIRKNSTVSNNNVTLAFSKNNASVTYTASPDTQNSYANKGEIVFKITSKGAYANLNNYTFSSEPTETTIKYVNSAPTSDTIYEYNDLGVVTAKLEIVGGKDSYEEDQATTTTTTGTDNEVRLVRRTTPIKFHDNKDKVKKGEDKLFRVYNATHTTEEVENGYHDLVNYKVPEFYDIPKFAEDDYVFAGWYTTYDNSDNSSDKAFKFNSEIPASVTDVYAHWIPVGEVDKQKDLNDPENKETNDFKILPARMNEKYKGFELFGVQIRPEYNFDHNYGDVKPGGLRFITSISEDLLSKVDALSDKTTNGNKVEYGFVTASESTVTNAMDKLGITNTTSYKLQYKGVNVNGVDTVMDDKTNKEDRKNANNFRYVTNVDCTSQVGGYGSNPKIKIDHHNYTGYRLATFVVTYDNNTDKAEKVAARAYMRYYDANGLLRTFYNDYGGTNFYGCCSTNYNDLYNAFKADRNTVS